jgi:hypothetical protein
MFEKNSGIPGYSKNDDGFTNDAIKKNTRDADVETRSGIYIRRLEN